MKNTLLFKNKKITSEIKDKNYPNFKPSKFITMKISGWLNGGMHVEQGQVLKLVKIVKKDKVMYIYQGLKKVNRFNFGFTDFTDEDVVEKSIYGAEQFLKIENDWFVKSDKLEKQILKSALLN